MSITQIARKMIVKIFYCFLCTTINIYLHERKFKMKQKVWKICSMIHLEMIKEKYGEKND